MTKLRIVDLEPVKEPYYGPHFLVPLISCQNPALDNPLLNSLYKPAISHTEKWYLELRRRILFNDLEHPLVQLVCVDLKLKESLIKSAIIDGSTMLDIIRDNSKPEYHVSASINLKKLKRWSGFFTSFPDSVDISLFLNDQAQG